MSLHTIVREGVVGRLHVRRAPGSVVAPRATDVAVRFSSASMRVLETGLALTALATALLMGLGR